MLLTINNEYQSVNSPSDLAELVGTLLETEHEFDQSKEHFYAIGLNTKNVVQYIDLVSLGTLDASLVHPRESFRHAVAMGVSSVAFAHNHPSGNVTPSNQDYLVTKKLVDAGKILGIDVIDHVIVGNDSSSYFSIHEHCPQYWKKI